MTTTIEDFMKTARPEQRELLLSLAETAEKEERLAGQVVRIMNSAGPGACVSDGFSVTPCEDEDDARIISANPRQELQRVRSQMRDYMLKAVELGMQDLGIIQRNYEHYVGKQIPLRAAG